MADLKTLTSAPADQTLGRLTQRVANQIGEAIVTGELETGEILPVEAALVEQYGASRSVLREAIKVLNAKGLVTAKPRRGTSVTPTSSWNLFDPDVLRWTLRRNFSLDLLIQFTQVRMGIEPQATLLATEKAAESDLAEIEKGFQRMVDAAKGNDDPLAADISFHLAILDASRNIFYARLKALVETALNFSIIYTDGIARDEKAKLDAHEAVWLAIKHRDSQAAAAAVSSLLSDALELMEKGVK